jgi:HEAT repeat protein
MGNSKYPGTFAGTVDEFVAGLKSNDMQERVDSAWALSQLGNDAKAALPTLIDALNDNSNQADGRVIGCVCDALLEMSPESRSAIPALRALLSCEKKSVQEEARLLLLFFENPAAHRAHFRKNRFIAAIVCILLFLLFGAIVAHFWH